MPHRGPAGSDLMHLETLKRKNNNIEPRSIWEYGEKIYLYVEVKSKHI